MSAPNRVGAGSARGGQFSPQERAEPDVDLYFHVAPASAWDSITEHGLDHTRGASAYENLYERGEAPRGNYLFADRTAADEYAEVREGEERDEYGPDEAEQYLVFEVRPAGPVFRDPFHDDESGLGASAVYTPDPIPADRISGPG